MFNSLKVVTFTATPFTLNPIYFSRTNVRVCLPDFSLVVRSYCVLRACLVNKVLQAILYAHVKKNLSNMDN